jgi:hypothetical protein
MWDLLGWGGVKGLIDNIGQPIFAPIETGVVKMVNGGFAVGLAIGAAIGVATGNFGMGLALGVALGFAFAAARQKQLKSED